MDITLPNLARRRVASKSYYWRDMLHNGPLLDAGQRSIRQRPETSNRSLRQKRRISPFKIAPVLPVDGDVNAPRLIITSTNLDKPLKTMFICKSVNSSPLLDSHNIDL